MSRENDLTRILGGVHAWRAILGTSPDRFLLDPKTFVNGRDMQRETPLIADDVRFLAEGPRDPLDAGEALIDRKQPRWLMGWRDICRSTDERTMIASVFPKVGVGHTMPIFFVNTAPKTAAAKLAMWTSLPFDYVARLSIGGTHLTYSYLKQFVALPPSDFTPTDLAFITPRVLELTYTSNAMRHWAEDLGHASSPFGWAGARRAHLRAELDALFALKFGLTRDELRYVLDPAEVKGADYPSETFRVLKTNEERRFGEYRTRRLVLEAFDRLSSTHIVTTTPIVLRSLELSEAALLDGAWARSVQPQPGDVGAVLAAILQGDRKLKANPGSSLCGSSCLGAAPARSPFARPAGIRMASASWPRSRSTRRECCGIRDAEQRSVGCCSPEPSRQWPADRGSPRQYVGPGVRTRCHRHYRLARRSRRLRA